MAIEGRHRRVIPRVALGITAIVLGTAVCALSPLIDSETLRTPSAATLHLSPAYLMLAPWCNVMDALTFLSLRQHIVMVSMTIVVYAMWRIVRWYRRRQSHHSGTRILYELGAACLLLLIVVAVYAVGVLVTRPMAKLVLHNPHAIAVDFHSHTDASWDGRRSFDAHANRAWHDEAGFDIAYVTDHATIAGARVGLHHNPALAGEGTILLRGLEARDADEHVIAINIDTVRDIDPHGQWHDPHKSTLLAKEIAAPILILSIPGNVTEIPYTEQRGNAPLFAVELSDASPKGIDQVHRDRARILQLADSLDLAVVAGSDNHGWGRAAVAWTVLHIPGWRTMTPDSLDLTIDQVLRSQRRRAAQVIERRSPDPDGSFMQLVETPFSVAVVMFRTLSWEERISWIVWVWVVWGIVSVVRCRRTRRLAV